MSAIKTTKTTEGKKDVVLKSFPATLHYAKIRDRATKGEFASGNYEVSLQVDETTASKLAALGVQVKTRENQPEMGTFVTANAKRFQPTVFGTDGKQYASNVNEEDNEDRGSINEIPLIGNGSTAEVTVAIYPNRESNVKQGRGGKMVLGLRSIRLTNLIEFIPTKAEPL